MPESPTLNLQVRNTGEYEEVIDRMGLMMEEYKFAYVEAFGILESVKNELGDQQMVPDDEE